MKLCILLLFQFCQRPQGNQLIRCSVSRAKFFYLSRPYNNKPTNFLLCFIIDLFKLERNSLSRELAKAAALKNFLMESHCYLHSDIYLKCQENGFFLLSPFVSIFIIIISIISLHIIVMQKLTHVSIVQLVAFQAASVEALSRPSFPIFSTF